MNLKENKYRKKQEAIINAAEHLFLKYGYGATTMDAIAEVAQVTKQTVYRYFSSKKNLFTTLIQREKESTKTFYFGDGSIHNELQMYAKAFITFHMHPKRLGLYQLMISESRTHPEIAEIFIEQAQPTWKPILINYLKEKLMCGDNSEIYAEMFNAYLLHVRPAILMGLLQPPTDQEVNHSAEVATTLFLQGVLAH